MERMGWFSKTLKKAHGDVSAITDGQITPVGTENRTNGKSHFTPERKTSPVFRGNLIFHRQTNK